MVPAYEEHIGVWVWATGKGYALPVCISREDYEWVIEQGNWFVTHAIHPSERQGYAARTPRGDKKRGLMWMHKEVLRRSVGPPPTPQHRIGDHWNGDRLDNRRCNLRWATPQMNANNIFGSDRAQLKLPLEFEPCPGC